MEVLIPILIQVVVGAISGNGVAAALKNVNLSKVLATITGIIGGVGGGQLAGLSGILEKLGPLLNSAEGGNILGEVASSGVGGAFLTAIVAMIKQTMAKKPA